MFHFLDFPWKYGLEHSREERTEAATDREMAENQTKVVVWLDQDESRIVWLCSRLVYELTF